MDKKDSKMNNNCYSLTSLKQTVKYLDQNCFFKTDPAPFLANLFSFCYESEWIGKMKNIDHQGERRFGHVYRYIDYLTAMNGNKEFWNSFKEIYSAELVVRK